MKGNYYTIEVRDREGKLLKRIRSKSRSYIKQWNQLIYVQCGCISNLAMKDAGGSSINVDYSSQNFRMDGAAGDAYKGVAFGTGSTAVTISDFQLATLITHGVGSGLLDYLANTLSVPSVSGSSCSFLLTRTAVNSSGAAITVREIGIGFVAYDLTNIHYFLAIRDVLPTSLSVPDDGAITVVYTIKATV